uniref:Uncharacterized protein n=1 Tax=Anguilla anguilla TaxID=7936 RepID=A0A0E9R8Z7_ANGAN
MFAHVRRAIYLIASAISIFLQGGA